MSSEFKIGDRVRSREEYRNVGHLYDGKILELDAVNRTAVIKGTSGPIPLSELELVEEVDPTIRNPITGRPA
jgi:hypothetical protein